MPTHKLFEDDSEEDGEDTTPNFSINNSYAEKYDQWRRKEDYQRLKDKYGTEGLDSDSESDSSEGDLAEPDNPEFDMDFFRVLAAIRSNHPSVNKEEKFFKESYNSGPKIKEKKEKPLTVKEYETKIILEKRGYLDDDDEEAGPSWKKKDDEEMLFDEVEKPKFRFDDNLSEEGDDDDEGLITIKKRNKEAQNQEEEVENEAIAFLKGKKQSLGNKEDEELLQKLKDDWKSNMSREDKFLMDYFVNQRYKDEEDEAVERPENHYILDIEPFEDDEKTFDKMEEYETKYRFRFEEPDEDFIRRYPRVINDTVRGNDQKRKELRQKKKDRQMEEEEKRKQEKMRLRAWKKKEIMERIEQLKNEAGKEDASFDGIDLDAEFDPDQHDASMAKIFNEEYYEEKYGNGGKPTFENEELNRELEEEYARLDDLDNMTEGNYRYTDVIANSYGLTIEEILCAKDSELNRWYSVNKMNQFGKADHMELRDKKNYEHRATLIHTKQKIFPSLFTDDIEEQWVAEEDRKRRRNLKKKERKMKKRVREHKGGENSAINNDLTTEEQSGGTPNKSNIKEPVLESNISNKNDNSSPEANLQVNDTELDQYSSKKPSESTLEATVEQDVEESQCDLTNSPSKKKKSKVKEIEGEENYSKTNLNGENIKDCSSLPEGKSENCTKLKGTKRKSKEVHKPAKKFKKKDKLSAISDARLMAYGENPKKVRRLLKYSERVSDILK